jgi:hypothetical protein
MINVPSPYQSIDAPSVLDQPRVKLFCMAFDSALYAGHASKAARTDAIGVTHR